MYLIRRVCPTDRSNVWQVANLLRKICEAYEANGRRPATVYVGGMGVPGNSVTVCAEWTQDTIEPNRISKVPEAVFTLSREMQQLISSYQIEFYEIATKEGLAERGLS